MVSNLKILAFSLIILSVISCNKLDREELSFPDDVPLVVEGWIESGNPPVVIVSSAIPALEQEQEISDLLNNILRYAKVSIEHDGVRYQLSSVISDEYFLKNYFTTGDFVGETGGEYKLRVEWNGNVATAVTTVPEPKSIDNLYACRTASSDTLYSIKAKVGGGDNPERYYRFFTRTDNKEDGYSPSFMGCFNDINRNFNVEILVLRGENMLTFKKDFYFHKGDLVSVKLASMNENIYSFWKGFEENSMCAALSFSSYLANVKGNVDGALGYWAGYGISIQQICIE